MPLLGHSHDRYRAAGFAPQQLLAVLTMRRLVTGQSCHCPLTDSHQFDILPLASGERRDAFSETISSATRLSCKMAVTRA
jgi:hypothetical protein